MAADKPYSSLSANTFMAKPTNHFQPRDYQGKLTLIISCFQRTRLITSSTDKHYSLDSELLTLSKLQSPATFLFRAALTRTITQDEVSSVVERLAVETRFSGCKALPLMPVTGVGEARRCRRVKIRVTPTEKLKAVVDRWPLVEARNFLFNIISL